LFGFCKPEQTNGKLFETAAVANGSLSCIRSGPDGTLRITVPVIAHTNGKLFETAAVANGFLSCIRSGPDGTLRTTVPVIA
jgi:hypothetical protein